MTVIKKTKATSSQRYGSVQFEKDGDTRVKFQIDTIQPLGSFGALDTLTEGLYFMATGTAILTFEDGSVFDGTFFAGAILPVRVKEISVSAAGTPLTADDIALIY